jgi:MraZ protein
MFDLRENKSCSMDDKGRFRLPSSLVNQLGEEHANEFVLHEAKDAPYLALYPKEVWKEKVDQYRKINLEIPKYRRFVRQALAGAVDVALDGSGRIQIPRQYLDKFNLEGSVKVLAFMDSIELWNEKTLEAIEAAQEAKGAPDDFNYEDMSEEVFGGIGFNKQDDGE